MLKTQKDAPPDLMQFSEAGVFLAAEEGLLRQHNAANIPNFEMLRPAFNMADDFSAAELDATLDDLELVFFGRVLDTLQHFPDHS